MQANEMCMSLHSLAVSEQLLPGIPYEIAFDLTVPKLPLKTFTTAHLSVVLGSCNFNSQGLLCQKGDTTCSAFEPVAKAQLNITAT